MEEMTVRLLQAQVLLPRVKARLLQARQARGLLFDFATWTRGYERALLALWDAAATAAPPPRARVRVGAGENTHAGEQHSSRYTAALPRDSDAVPRGMHIVAAALPQHARR
jgi:hypothetical protein